jgi:hypothetical protein
MSAKRWLITITVLVFVPLMGVAALNVWVDPYQAYRLSDAPRYYAAFQRHVVPGLAKHADYDTAIIGSSMFENTLPVDVDRALGGKSINLALSAMSATDASDLLAHVLRIGKAKRVVFGVDYSAFARPNGYRGFANEPWPAHLYDRSAINDAAYVLATSTTEKSVEWLMGRQWNRFSRDSSNMWGWADPSMEYGEAAVMRGVNPKRINDRFSQPALDQKLMLDSLRELIETHLKSHPQVHFHLVLPPYSKVVWADFLQRKQVESALAFRRVLVEVSATLPNVSVHDFQCDDRVRDLANYKDAYHYGPHINQWMVDAISSNSHRVTTDNVITGEERLRAIAINSAEEMQRR